MENSANHFETAEELAGLLSKTAKDIEERAYAVMEHGALSAKKNLMEGVFRELRMPWKHRREETGWRATLVLTYKDFSVEHGFLKPDKGELPVPEKKPVGRPRKSKNKE